MQDVPGRDATAAQEVCGMQPGQAKGSFHTEYVEMATQRSPNLHGVHDTPALQRSRHVDVPVPSVQAQETDI